MEIQEIKTQKKIRKRDKKIILQIEGYIEELRKEEEVLINYISLWEDLIVDNK